MKITTARIDADTRDKLKRLARLHDMSVGEYIRVLTEDALDEMDENDIVELLRGEKQER